MEKREEFLQRLAKARKNLEQGNADKASPRRAGQGLAVGWRLALELVIAMSVAGVIGWWLDYWFGTTPLFLLILIALGSVAGVWNVYRESQIMAQKTKRPPRDT